MDDASTNRTALRQLQREIRELREQAGAQSRELAALRELVDGAAVPLGRMLLGQPSIDGLRWAREWVRRGGLAWQQHGPGLHDWMQRYTQAAVSVLSVDEPGTAR